MKNDRPRISDVARLAGVSTATVSRALSNPALVSPETRATVQEAISATGYRLNRCWNHHENVGGGDGTLAFDDESALLLDDSGRQWIITDDGDLIDVHEEDYPEGATA